MKVIASNPYVMHDMTYEYDGTTYHVVIHSGKAEYSEVIDCYGDLYPAGKYGGTAVEYYLINSKRDKALDLKSSGLFFANIHYAVIILLRNNKQKVYVAVISVREMGYSTL